MMSHLVGNALVVEPMIPKSPYFSTRLAPSGASQYWRWSIDASLFSWDPLQIIDTNPLVEK